MTNRLIRFAKRYPKQADAVLLILGYSLGANLFVLFKLSGLKDLGIDTSLIMAEFHWSNPSLVGLFIGVAFYLLEFGWFQKAGTRLSHRSMLVMRITIGTLIICCSTLGIHILTDLFIYDLGLSQSLVNAADFFTSRIFLTLYLYLTLLGIALNFLRSLGNRFGHGIIANYLLGKYRTPVEEERVFMFLDLNGSTKAADELGHVKYSRMLNKCFADLSAVLAKSHGEVYQYVGDEVVITWLLDDIGDMAAPVRLFQDYERILTRHEQEYLAKFQWIPKFKAAINCGFVSVSEVGVRKKELVYHGDVLNTASRVLELCSNHLKSLLMTEGYAEKLGDYESQNLSFFNELLLRGKNDVTKIYEVTMTG